MLFQPASRWHFCPYHQSWHNSREDTPGAGGRPPSGSPNTLPSAGVPIPARDGGEAPNGSAEREGGEKPRAAADHGLWSACLPCSCVLGIPPLTPCTREQGCGTLLRGLPTASARHPPVPISGACGTAFHRGQSARLGVAKPGLISSCRPSPPSRPCPEVSGVSGPHL